MDNRYIKKHDCLLFYLLFSLGFAQVHKSELEELEFIDISNFIAGAFESEIFSFRCIITCAILIELNDVEF